MNLTPYVLKCIRDENREWSVRCCSECSYQKNIKHLKTLIHQRFMYVYECSYIWL